MVDSNESSFGDDVIRISIYHGGKLNWIPRTDNDNQNQIDEEEMNGIMNQIYGEEMHSTYTEMLLDYPEEGPGMTQPTQKTAFSKFTSRANSHVCLDVEEGQSIQKKVLHNSYTGPMKLGKQMPPPVKQYKAIVGKTKVTSAPFLSHGKNVITTGALTSALNNLKNAGTGTTSGKGKEKQP